MYRNVYVYSSLVTVIVSSWGNGVSVDIAVANKIHHSPCGVVQRGHLCVHC